MQEQLPVFKIKYLKLNLKMKKMKRKSQKWKSSHSKLGLRL